MASKLHERAEQLDKQLSKAACRSGFQADRDRERMAIIESALREQIEACAKVAEEYPTLKINDEKLCDAIAAAIRQRGGQG